MKLELLAPAGDLDAAYAAFHYGADAIYLGLKRFSARAEAANFSPQELSEIVAFAHKAEPRRSVFVALNTLILEDELDEAIEALALIESLGVDAVIVQDLGMARLVKRYFPRLALHASTQMAIHNPEGAIVARLLGFSRVTLARELTLAEVGAISRQSGLEVETFIHGALCYSYSGLCLYSSILRGRSGNRGRCAYPCRDCFESQAGQSGYPFSMKDLALAGDVLKACESGVFSYKIEGRKKSPLYVAAVTHYYRGLLDRTLSAGAKRAAEEDIKTIFARPWTELYARTTRNREVTDADVVGHRGAPIGQVMDVVRQGRESWIRFKTGRRLERHDGIQTDVPGQGRPFGFPVDRLRLMKGRDRHSEEVFEAPAHSVVEVSLPAGHPDIEPGAPLYCSSSQEVKQRYRFPRPKPGAFRVRESVVVAVTVTPEMLKAEMTIPGLACSASASLGGVFEPCRDVEKVEHAVRSAFEKLGDTEFELQAFQLVNAERLFVPVSLVNRLRREVVANLGDAVHTQRENQVLQVKTSESSAGGDNAPASMGIEQWSIKVDRLEHLESLQAADGMTEIVIDIRRDSKATLYAGLASLKSKMEGVKLRMALPLLTREPERADLVEKITMLREQGMKCWEVSGLSAWRYLDLSPGMNRDLDLTADWPLYVTNRSAAQQLLAMGVTRFTLSPEDGGDNIRALLARFGEKASVIVYQDTPLFISENCALAAMARRCPAGAGCRDSEREWISGSGETIRLTQQGCRTVALAQTPLSWVARLDELRQAGAKQFRMDFIHRHYEADEVRERWCQARQGRAVAGHEGNFRRGMM